MRYWEIIEAGKPDHDAEHDPQERAELWRKLDSARHKGSRAGQDYQDSVRSADNEQRKAQQKLAENGNDETDPDTEHQRWKRYWAKQKRLNQALAADAEKRSRGLSGNVSACQSVPVGDQQTGW